MLVTYARGGIEKFLEEAGEPARSERLPPAPDGPPDIARLTRIAAQYGMDIPPPTD